MFPFYMVMLLYDTTSPFSKDDKGKSSISKNYNLVYKRLLRSDLSFEVNNIRYI